MVGLVGPIKWSVRTLFKKKQLVICLRLLLLSYIWQKTWNKKFRKRGTRNKKTRYCSICPICANSNRADLSLPRVEQKPKRIEKELTKSIQKQENYIAVLIQSRWKQYINERLVQYNKVSTFFYYIYFIYIYEYK